MAPSSIAATVPEYSFLKLKVFRECLNMLRFSQNVTLTERTQLREAITKLDDKMTGESTRLKVATEEFEELKKLEKYQKDEKLLKEALKQKNEIEQLVTDWRTALDIPVISIGHNFEDKDDYETGRKAALMEVEGILVNITAKDKEKAKR